MCRYANPFRALLNFYTGVKAQRKTLICVTNKPEHPARGILDILDMAHYFDDTIGGDRFTERKPHPRQLLHCVEHYACAASDQVLMIGDSV